MASAAPHNAYAELFEQLDALTSRGFGAWCAQALGDEVVYAIDVDWYRAGAQVSEVLAQAGREPPQSASATNSRAFGRLLYGASPLGLARAGTLRQHGKRCRVSAPRANGKCRCLPAVFGARRLRSLERGGRIGEHRSQHARHPRARSRAAAPPDRHAHLQYAVLENESALLRSTCIKMGSYDQRGGIDPATLAFIDRGGWDAFQPIVRNRNFAKTQRRIGTLLDSPGYSEASDAELPLAESQLGSIPSTPKPANRKAGADWVKYLAKRTFFTVIEGNIDILAGQAGAMPACRVELARTGWLWKFTQGRAEDASARRTPIAADDSAAWQQAGQLLARWIWECSTATTPGGTIHAVDDATLALAAAAGNENGLVEFRLLRQALRRGLGKACWMFNWLQKKSGRTDRGVFVREQASYIVNHYLGPQFAAVLYGIAHDMELDRAGLGAATAEQGFGSMQIEPPASGAPMPAGLNRTLALEISIAPAGDRPVPGSEALWKTVSLDGRRACRLGRDPSWFDTPEDSAGITAIILSSADIGRQALDLRIREDSSLRATVDNPAGVWIENHHVVCGEQADLHPGEHIFIPGNDLSYVIVPRWQIVA
ncbi:MAG: hypothetical protein ACLS3Y_05140 [Collinsella sp.]